MAHAAAVDLQPIDRLEEKVRQLVSMIDALRAERTTAIADATRLKRELDAARARIGEAEVASAEVTSLRQERDLIRTRVTEMLTQIDKLNL